MIIKYKIDILQIDVPVQYVKKETMFVLKRRYGIKLNLLLEKVMAKTLLVLESCKVLAKLPNFFRPFTS